VGAAEIGMLAWTAGELSSRQAMLGRQCVSFEEISAWLSGWPYGMLHSLDTVSSRSLSAAPCNLGAMSQEHAAMSATPSLPTALFIRRSWYRARTF
jgi:hypothetical protein